MVRSLISFSPALLILVSHECRVASCRSMDRPDWRGKLLKAVYTLLPNISGGASEIQQSARPIRRRAECIGGHSIWRDIMREKRPS